MNPRVEDASSVMVVSEEKTKSKFLYFVVKRIFDLYENEIMKKQNITKFTDRYIGKKVYNYLKNGLYICTKYFNDNVRTSNCLI